MLIAFFPIAIAMSVLGLMIGWLGFRRPVFAYLWCVVVSAAALFALLMTYGDSRDLMPARIVQLLFYWAMPYIIFFLLPTFGMASIVMSVRGVRAARRRQLEAMGLCPSCAYDLRATPGRCPECGLVPATPPPPPPPLESVQ